ncbi:MAG TPA: glycoside hydrolase domain-containing protein [Anaerolineales bacterium]|nr:glycoside hydrolase domain-containing protein [Anaerolineales bacterium]
MFRVVHFTRRVVLILSPIFLLLLWRSAVAQAGDSLQLPLAGSTGATILYLPFVASAPVEFTAVWTQDLDGSNQLAFLAGSSFVHLLSGTSFTQEPITAHVVITATGPCGTAPLFSGPVDLPPGAWLTGIQTSAPVCPGIYTSDVTLEYAGYYNTLQALYVVNEPIQPLSTVTQGFDRCVPPSPVQLAAWRAEAPYSVFNIYLGGALFPQFCRDPAQNAFWVHEVASQGWSFTAIWVGPQPPCTNYSQRFSLDTATAYQEGGAEAVAAAARARELGLFGDLTLHYDIEGYASTATTACRTAVKSFLQGWTDRLHDLDLQAGAYGGGCSSFVTDWNDNNPVIDQVWIAHWALPAAYNPDATVWNAACVSNSLWTNHQRIKQYAGDHAETWGGVTLTVDSNVFDTTTLGWAAPGGETAPAFVADFGILGASSGWLLSGGRIYRTDDLGLTWFEITPNGFTVLGAAFTGSQTGWAAGWQTGDPALQTARTTDGGLTWTLSPVGDPGGPIATAYIEILDGNHVWIALKLQTGSAFSRGALYASADGGATWERRDHPLGEPVVFSDAQNGWTSGGPAGVQAFRTADGGRTWNAVDPAEVPAGSGRRVGTATLASAPVMTAALDDQFAWALTREGLCLGPNESRVCALDERLWVTQDGGDTWVELPVPAGP